jgi:hypothetical protein
MFAEHSWMTALPGNGAVTWQSPISCRFWQLFWLAGHIVGLGNHMDLTSLSMKPKIISFQFMSHISDLYTEEI